MLKELKSQHRNIIQMSFNGYSNNEIAERLGMAHTSVSTILRSPLGQAYLHGLQDRSHEATLDVRKKLVTLNKSALDTFARLLNPKEKAPHAVQFNAAKDVLDRNGYKAPDRLNIDMTFQTKTDEELDAEIAAIESAISRTSSTSADSNQSAANQIVSGLTPILRSPPVQNLPENKDSSKQTIQTPYNFIDTPSANYSPVTAPVPALTTEEELSLEDFFDCTSVLTEEEVPLIEDPSLIDGLPLDIFNSGKRP